MATRPTVDPAWATTTSTDATSGQLTVKEPTAAQKATGHVYNTTFKGNLDNWYKNIQYQWQQYFKEHVDQFAVAQQSTPNMTVQVTAGLVNTGTAITSVAAQNSATLVAPVTNPRIDVIVLNSSNVVTVRAGTEAASPAIPAHLATDTPLAYITLATTTTTITNSIITPYRNNPWAGVTNPLTIGTLTLASGSITDSSGAITFDNENISTTGTLASGAHTVTGALTTSGAISVNDVTDSTSGLTGSIHTDGGIGVVKQVYAGGRIITDDVTDSTSGITGSIQTDGGLGVAKAVFAGTTVTANTLVLATGSITDTTGAITFSNENLTTTGWFRGGVLSSFGLAATDGTLHVHTATAGVVTADTGADDLVIENNSNGGISILTPDADSARVYLGSPTDNSGGIIEWTYDTKTFVIGSNTATGLVSIVSAAGTEAIRINASQNIGIGTAAPDGRLHVHTATAGVVTADTASDDLVVENSVSGGISILTPVVAGVRGILNFGSPTTNRGAELSYSEFTSELRLAAINGGYLAIATGLNVEAVRINSQGRVGIGPDAVVPNGPLHITEGSAGSVDSHPTADILTIEGSGSVGMSLLATDANDSMIAFGSLSDNVGARCWWNYNASLLSISTAKTGAGLSLRSDQEVEAIRINSSQNVGIGTNAPDGRLHVHTATAGAVTALANADDLVVESSGDTGISILSPDVNSSWVIFGSPSDNIGAIFKWDYSVLTYRIGTRTAGASMILESGNGTDAVTISSTQNVGIGGTANANALLDVQSTTKAFMPPRMTTTQKNAIASPTSGMVVYDSTLGKLAVYGAAAWEAVTSA